MLTVRHSDVGHQDDDETGEEEVFRLWPVGHDEEQVRA